MSFQTLSNKREKKKINQEEFSDRAAVALTVLRKIEQRKENLIRYSVNKVLKMFGYVLAPMEENDIS